MITWLVIAKITFSEKLTYGRVETKWRRNDEMKVVETVVRKAQNYHPSISQPWCTWKISIRNSSLYYSISVSVYYLRDLRINWSLILLSHGRCSVRLCRQFYYIFYNNKKIIMITTTTIAMDIKWSNEKKWRSVSEGLKVERFLLTLVKLTSLKPPQA